MPNDYLSINEFDVPLPDSQNKRRDMTNNVEIEKTDQHVPCNNVCRVHTIQGVPRVTLALSRPNTLVGTIFAAVSVRLSFTHSATNTNGGPVFSMTTRCGQCLSGLWRMAGAGGGQVL